MNKQEYLSGWVVYKRLLRQAIKNKGSLLFFALLGMIITASTDPALSAIMKPMLDGAFVGKEQSTIDWIPLALLAIFLARATGIYLTICFMAQVGRNLVVQLRAQMFEKLMTLPSAYYDQASSGDLISRISYNVERVTTTASKSLTILIRDSLTIIGLLSWMFYLSWILTICFLLVGPLVALLVSKLNKRFRRLSHKTQESIGEIIQDSHEVIQGNRIVKIFSGRDFETSSFSQINEKNRKINIRLATTEGANSAIIMMLVGFALSGIVFLATIESILSVITVGTFVSFMFAMLMILAPARNLANVNARLQQAIAAGQNVYQLIDAKPEVDQGHINAFDAHAAIRFENVSLQYDTGEIPILDNVSFNVSPYETVALVGRSGCGKTSLVNLLPRFYEITSGKITIGDVNLQDISLAMLRKKISYVGQDIVLFNDTVKNNIAYALPGLSDDKINQAAEAANALSFINELPEKFDTIIGENGVLLSGGQKQRLAIARALLKDAPILILDEATSALDTESEKYIHESFVTLKKNRTTLVVAHHYSTVENADKIILLDKGRILETGTHAELLALNGTYSNFYNLQTKQSVNQ